MFYLLEDEIRNMGAQVQGVFDNLPDLWAAMYIHAIRHPDRFGRVAYTIENFNFGKPRLGVIATPTPDVNYIVSELTLNQLIERIP